jgi:hypothetical protein
MKNKRDTEQRPAERDTISIREKNYFHAGENLRAYVCKRNAVPLPRRDAKFCVSTTCNDHTRRQKQNRQNFYLITFI